MKTLWQRTTYLFWQYPILWLPLVIADVLGFSLRQLQKMLTHNIIFWVVQHGPHSVLGNTPDPLSMQSSTATNAALLSAPITWTAQFIYVCLYVMAFLITAALIQFRSEGSKGGPRAALSKTYTRWKDILWFAFKMMLLLMLAAFSLGALIWLFNLVRIPVLYQTIITTLFLSIAIAYRMAPSAVRLLRWQSTSPLSSEDQRISRNAAMLAVLVSTVLGLIQQAEAQLVYGTHLWITFFNTVSSLLIALPYIPLFIALGLVANPAEATLDPLESPAESP